MVLKFTAVQISTTHAPTHSTTVTAAVLHVPTSAAACSCVRRLLLLRRRLLLRQRRVYMSRGDNCMRASIIMCELHSIVARILRQCGVPWSAARLRYLRLHCALRHLYGRQCARRRDVADVVSVILEDWMHQYHPRREPSRKLLERLALLELDLVSNGQVSPFFGAALPQ
jgi:hypothetical protein